jgi:hypothetical protein
LQDAKQALNIPATNTASDDEIQGMIDTIVSSLEKITGGPLLNRSITERVSVSPDYRTLSLRKGPLVSVTSITDIASSVAMTITDLDLDTNAGIVRRKLGLPFLSRGPVYTVVYVAGWGTVLPAAFNQAARMILSHLWDTQRGPSARPWGGDEETVLTGMSYAIPNRALEILSDFTQEAYV